MATNHIDNQTRLAAAPVPAARFSVGDIATAIVTPLASLRLTVALLFLAVLVTWVATMEQAFEDVFEVKTKHFSSLLVSVPVQRLFPPAWCPKLQSIPGTLTLPSGITIMALMIVNLTVAHALRFKIQATGKKLVFGLLAAVAAVGVTFAVVANAQGPGVQTQPLIAYESMWKLLPWLLLAGGGAFLGWSAFLPTKKKAQRLLLIYLGCIALMMGGALWYFNDATYIGDSAMRIMWQLIQATLAAIAGYVASIMLFKRKAGMVLLHLGVLGLMLNEIWVTTAHNEQRLTIEEGQTVSHAIDIRYQEMAIVDVSHPDHDRIITVPADKLQREQVVASPELPFDIRCVGYMENSALLLRPAADNLATHGIGLSKGIQKLLPVAGTDTEQTANAPSAYVELFKKGTNQSLGTYMLSTRLATGQADQVVVDGRTYRILLRFQTQYKPYAVKLNDATRESYPGTQTPKYYGSEVTIFEFDSQESSDQRIYMNNPLRYSGETFYQSGMSEPGEQPWTVLSVVTNVGWMIPYVCCMFTVVGLFGQFGQSLASHLNKESSADKPDGQPQAKRRMFWVPALVVLAILGAYGGSKFFRSAPVVEKDGMRLDLLGQIPITHGGRVQPLDSFARNTLRQLRTRETVDDDNNDSQPAIAWLADLIFDAPGSGEYRTFYMTDPNVKNALRLPTPDLIDRQRKKYVYTVAEIVEAADKMQALTPDPKVVPQKEWTPLQRNVFLLKRKLNQAFGVKILFGPPATSIDQQARFLMDARSFRTMPCVVPQGDPDQPWASLPQAMGPVWIQSIADGLTDVRAIAAAVVQEDFVVPELERFATEDKMIPRILKRVTDDPAFETPAEDIEKILADPKKQQAMWQIMDADTRSTLLTEERTRLSAIIQREARPRFESLASRLQTINDGSTEVSADVAPAVSVLMKLKPAYVAGDADTFNETLKEYLASIEAKPPAFYSGWSHRLEQQFNRASPFYLSIVFYIVTLLAVAIGWLGWGSSGWQISLGRVALVILLLAVFTHGSGILMRVCISGRPPVTNLYSSVLFVTWVGVLIAILQELFSRQGIGSALGATTGVAGLLWAQSMANIDGDTFTVMVAVLDTTFWLATHVIMISLGYAATFMAGLLGLVFLMVNFTSSWFNDPAQRRRFINILYGTVCFGLLASFFGTVLGGLWGDDSWGRFWGWDPKENGALMIVLWNALVLHARWGGLVKERGVAALAIVGNVIVLWSWKGVNALGVGLHAYAASEDKSLVWFIWVAVIHLIIASLALMPSRMRFFPTQKTS